MHDGTITALAPVGTSHVLSAAADGRICVWRASDFAPLKTLKGHTGAVNALAVHPLGTVLLSAGHDRTLRTWDLTTVCAT